MLLFIMVCLIVGLTFRQTEIAREGHEVISFINGIDFPAFENDGNQNRVLLVWE
jgi:hypothetical protein